jgi:hypothetical protein
MGTAAVAADDRCMTDSIVEHQRELFALRRLERNAEAERRLLDRRLRELNERHERAARRLATEYRRTHFGKSPEPWPAARAEPFS